MRTLLAAAATAATLTHTSATFIEFEYFEFTYEADAMDVQDYSYAPVYAYDSHNNEIDLCERIYLEDYDGDDDDADEIFSLCCTPDERASMIDGCELVTDSGVFEAENIPDVCSTVNEYACAGVDTTAVNNFYLSYDACDYSYNCAAEKFYEVAFLDTTPPVVSSPASGSFTDYVEKCTYYDMPEITAMDTVSLNVEPTVSIVYGATVFQGNYNANAERDCSPLSGQYCVGGEVVDAVDADTVGTYCAVYEAVDGAGNLAYTESLVVYVQDTIPPTIEMTPSDTVECAAETDVPDNGAVGANLPCCDEPEVTGLYSLTGDVDGLTTVDLDSVGEYTIAYTCTDGYNDATEYFSLTVEDTTPPTITCPNNCEIHVFEDLPEECSSPSVSDTCDGEVDSAVAGTVDNDSIGEYSRVFTATDDAGLTSSCTQIVEVVDLTDPTLEIDECEWMYVEACTGTYIEYGATAIDEYDVDIQSKVTTTGSEDVDVSTLGTYTVTYGACDQSDNCAVTMTRYVIVQDTTPPTIAVDGDEVAIFEASDRSSATSADVGATCTDTCPNGDGDGSLFQYLTYEVAAFDYYATPNTEAANYVDWVDEQQYYCGRDIGYMQNVVDYVEAQQTNGGSLTVDDELDALSDECGLYEITYSCSDANGLSVTALQYVATLDTTAPVIYYGSYSDSTISFLKMLESIPTTLQVLLAVGFVSGGTMAIVRFSKRRSTQYHQLP